MNASHNVTEIVKGNIVLCEIEGGCALNVAVVVGARVELLVVSCRVPVPIKRRAIKLKLLSAVVFLLFE